MNDFKLKIVLSALVGLIFSFIFIILSFTLPIDEKKEAVIKKPKGKLEQISHAIKTKH